MKYEMGSDKSWLESCPAGDCNFKAHLKTATVEEIEELIAELPELFPAITELALKIDKEKKDD